MSQNTSRARTLGRRTAAAAVSASLLCTALAGSASAGSARTAPAPDAAAGAAGPVREVVVQATDVAAAENAVVQAGGTVTRTLPVVDGVAAEVPAGSVADLRSRPGVRAVTANAALTPKTYSAALGYDPVTTTGSLHAIAAMTGAHAMYKAGISGKGVDVALIDSGIAPVKGLTSGNVVNGPDLSFDSQESALVSNDGFGHGTHMASIIAGRDVVQTRAAGYVDQTRFVGIAPDARLINLKVASADGGTDVTQVLAAIDWVVQNKNKHGFNIRVMNLSYGTDSVQPVDLDPLAHAVEVAWRAGVVVVVSGGNDGNDKPFLGMPAQDPLVLAVGAQNPNGTLATGDDTVPSWASKGSTGAHQRTVDLVAPGVRVLGLRAPNSSLDHDNPSARIGTRFLRGSGTSQSAAVVSGAVALYLQKHPTATPDQVKGALLGTATPMLGSAEFHGRGALDVARASKASPPNTVQKLAPTTGLGSLDAARGTMRVVDYPDDVTETPLVLEGERDVFGNAFPTADWAARSTARTSYDATGAWMGRGLVGSGFDSTSWAGRSWSGRSWSGRSWSGRSWSGRSWSGRSWSGDSWDGRSWSGRSWSGRSWSGRSWSSQGWSAGLFE